MSKITETVIYKNNNAYGLRRQPRNPNSFSRVLTEQDITESFVASLPQTVLKELGLLWQYFCRTGRVHPSQKTIGHKIGKSDRTVRRCNEKLKDLGLIATDQHYNDSLDYKLTPVLLLPRVRSLLSRFNRAFNFLPLWMLAVYGEIQGDVRLGLSICYIDNPPELVSHMEDLKKSGEKPSEISHVLRSLTCIKLTKWGQIRLACYPDAALLYAQSQFLRTQKGTINAPFSWFKAICESYCRQKNLTIDRKKVESLHIIFPEPERARYFIPHHEIVSDNTLKLSSRIPEDPHKWHQAQEQLKSDPRTSWLFTPDTQPCPLAVPYGRSNAESDGVPTQDLTRIIPGHADLVRRHSQVMSWIHGQDDPG